MEPFVRATFSRFFQYLYRYVGNEVDCEDVLEQVYADIWEDPSRIVQASNNSELLRLVYLYYMRRHLRQLFFRRTKARSISPEVLAEAIAPQRPVLEGLCDQELRQALHLALSRLKGRQRQAIDMWCQGLSNRAIANRLGTTIGATKMLLHRGLLRLRQALDGLDVKD